MDETKHSFPPPVFKSKVLRARLLLDEAGLRFVWNEERYEFVLEGGDNLWEQDQRKS